VSNRPIRNKNCQWWPCLLMDRDKMSSLYREPSIDAAYEVSVHLAKRFQRRRLFRNQLTNMAITGNSCFWLDDLKKSSPVKPLGQMNRNVVGSIHGRSSIKIAHFVLIRQQTWPPQAIYVSDWLIL
jgi:hypothetical protein